MCQIQSKRHIIGCFIGSIPEHHTLITSSLIIWILTFHTAVDITALFMDRRENATRFRFKLVFTLGITDLLDYITGYFLYIYIRI